MSSMRRYTVLFTAAGLAACGTTALPIATSPNGHGAGTDGKVAVAPAHLWVEQADAASGSIQVVDAARGRAMLSLPIGVATADSTRLFAVTHRGGGGPSLEAIDTHGGTTIAATALPAGFDLPVLGPDNHPVGLSPDARHLAIVSRPASGATVTTSHLLLFDTAALGRQPLSVDLPGDFSFDGVNNAATNLYLLENLHADTVGGEYRVRRYDLVAHALDPNVVIDKATGERGMAGTPVDQATPAGGHWQFTVYAFGSGSPFVHALNLDDGFAYCIDLPKAPRDEALDLLWALVTSHEGARVYAVNAGNGVIVEMDGSAPWKTRRGTLPLPVSTRASVQWPWQAVPAAAKRIVHGGASISLDDRTVYALGDHGISVVDATSLAARSTLMGDSAFASLTLGGDGHNLYAVTADTGLGLLQIDVNGRGWTQVRGVDQPVSVLRALP